MELEEIIKELNELNFSAIDLETANEQRNSICSIGLVTVKNGNIITINHWSVIITGFLEIFLPPVLPTNFPIPFTTEEEIQHD